MQTILSQRITLTKTGIHKSTPVPDKRQVGEGRRLDQVTQMAGITKVGVTIQHIHLT